jgi:hypothetical protein
MQNLDRYLLIMQFIPSCPDCGKTASANVPEKEVAAIPERVSGSKSAPLADVSAQFEDLPPHIRSAHPELLERLLALLGSLELLG